MMLAGLHCACLVLLHVVMSCHLLFFQCLSRAHLKKKNENERFSEKPLEMTKFLASRFLCTKGRSRYIYIYRHHGPHV